MKITVRLLSVVTALAMLFSVSLPARAAGKTPYTYTVTISAGTQGTISADGISVDGGGDYSIVCDGRQVVITGLTGQNHVRFLNSAVTLGEDSKYYVRGVRMGGRDNNTVDLAYFEVERDQDYVVAYGIRGNMVQYTIHYEDAEGNELYPPQTYYGNVGDRPVVAYLYVEGYQPQAYNLTRTLQEDASKNVFTFVYTRTPVPAPVQPPTGGGTAVVPNPAPTGGQPATPQGGTPAAPEIQAPEVPVPPAGGEDAGEEAGGENPLPGNPGNVDIPDNETPQNNGPENLIDIDDEENPLANLPSGDDGTIAAANRQKLRYALIAGGIGLAAVIALIAGLYVYRRMRKARNEKPEGE